MPDVAKLKKKASEFELKKQFDKALAAYVEILDTYEVGDPDADLSLYNRVGDIYLKQGNVADAVDYYEQAVDRYADGGFFNNAIALCNKILRNSPGRASVYYKLGRISAQKGFKGDAKANYLEYADRMQQAGRIDEAFRALKEFADLCPDQDDIRLMLADQLTRKGRSEEAIEQLQLLYERYQQEGRGAEANATVARMKAIDPKIEPRSPTDGGPRRGSADLVFLDLDDSGGRRALGAKGATQGLNIIDKGEQPKVAPVAAAPRAPAPAPPAPAPPAAAPPAPDPVIAASPAPTPEVLEVPELEPEVLDGVTRAAEFDAIVDVTPESSLLEGLESTSFDANLSSPSGSLLDLQPTSFEEPEPVEPTPPPAPPHRPSLAGLPMLVDDAPAESDAGAAADDVSIGGDLTFYMPEEEPAPAPKVPAAKAPVPKAPAPRAPAPAREPEPEPDVDEIPLMDFELPMPGEATARITGSPVSHAAPPEFEMVDFDDLPAPIARTREPIVGPPMIEVSPAELDVRADLLPESVIEPVAESSFAPAFEPEPFAPQLEEAAPIELEEEPEIAMPPRRSSTMLAAQSVDMLRALAEADPDDNALRRRLAEALLESGDREEGIGELETVMINYERADDLDAASSIADEIVRLNPGSVRHHQKRVEYAFRTNERGRLIEAYLELADALFRVGQMEKSRAIYQRVLDLSPDDMRAQSALLSFPEPEPEPEPPAPKGRTTQAVPRASISTRSSTKAAAAPPPPRPATPDDEFVNLGDWLRDDASPKDTRMVVEEQEPTGDEEADFQDMLRKFKQGIAENVEEEDHQSHYDLGVAYKEMGLLDEAIAEFQKALRAPSNRVPTYEALGQCFIEKEQYPMAATILQRALNEKMSDDQLVGVLYLLGLCAEMRGQLEQAVEFYQRVFVVDIQFRDVGDRLAAVEGAR